MPTISFLILTFNSENYIGRLLESLDVLVGEKIKKKKYEVVVVDNHSTDKTREILKNYSFIRLVNNNSNVGYAKGINIAVAASKGKYLVVVNPDAYLKEADFEKVISEFEKNNSLGIAGLKIEDENGNSEKSAGSFFNPFTFLLYSLGLEWLAGVRFSPKKAARVDYVSGGFVVFKREVFEALRGFDEEFFMYVEDMDICYRARKIGFSSYFLPYATIVHKGQGSSNREFAIRNIYKGLIIYYKKHSSALMLLYVKSLLRLKAQLIIFLGRIFGNNQLVSIYQQALKSIQ